MPSIPIPVAHQNHRQSLNLTIRALCQEGRLKDALHILLTETTTNPSSLVDSSTCVQLLQTCIDKNALSEGKLIHSLFTRSRFAFANSTFTFLQNKLIHLYVNCGSLVDACKVFDCMTERDVFSWNMIISAHHRHGFSRDALSLFRQMQQTQTRAGTAVQPNQFTFPSILQACAKLGNLQWGLPIHQTIIKTGFLSDIVVASALTDMYAKCGTIEKARDLFDKMPHRSAESWTAMIVGYAQSGLVEKASELFDKMPDPDAVSWTAIIAGYAQNGLHEKALEIYKQMQLAGAKPSSGTFPSILPVCAKMGALEQGMDIHQRIIKSGFSSDVVVVNALIDMYAKCGSVDKAREAFDEKPQRDAVSWNAMISGYAQNGLIEEAHRLFDKMPQKDAFSWNAMIGGYAQNGLVEIARELFDKMLQLNEVSWNVMIAGYAQNGHVEKAHELFNKMPERDVVSWNAMIAGYAQNGLAEKALEILKQMQLADIKPNSATFASILPACAKLGALEEGMDIHQKAIENRVSSDVIVASALVDMYAKCGSLHKARELFDKMHNANSVSWNAMISGYATHGNCEDALKLFELMKCSETKPNSVSFICVLFACSHGGQVDLGCKNFNNMINSYCIMPARHHYVCMVDILSRAGYLDEALNFIVKMPIKPDAVVWMCLLGTCRSHKNVNLAEFVAALLFVLDSKNASPYVLLSSIYAEVGRWVDAQKVRKLMKERRIKKTTGCSWIEVHKTVHAFCA